MKRVLFSIVIFFALATSAFATPPYHVDNLGNIYANSITLSASGTANYFWATPNGSTGPPSLRAIVAADIPALSYQAPLTNPLVLGGSYTPTGTWTWSSATWVGVPTLNQSTSGTAAKATNLVGGNANTLLGAVPYQSAADTTSFANNVTTTRKFLREVGDGTNSTVPVFDTLQSADIPSNAANTSGKAATAGNADTVTGATLTTALTVNTGTVTLSGNIANTSTLVLPAGSNTLGSGAFTLAYSLPTASNSILGGVKPDGTTITNTVGAISVTYPLTSAPGSAAYTASTAYQLAGATQGSMTCLAFGGMSSCQYAASVLNNGTITLPTATSGWPLRCEIETGDDTNSALFTVTSGGTASPISSSAGIVFNLATASKVQVGAVSPANPLIITNASGGTLNIWVACKYK